jgi:predicted acyl esterase
MPENANRNPGPGFDSKAEMVRWFNHWLKDDNDNDDIVNEPNITLFIRTSLMNGIYRYELQWPIPRQQVRRLYMIRGRRLTEQMPSTLKEKSNNKNNVEILEYRPLVIKFSKT